MEGFDRSSVDAVAPQAKVSKRTVYDYFGDKQALLISVVEDAGRSVIAAIQRAMEDSLIEVKNLEQALTTFCKQIVISTKESLDYSAYSV